MTSPSARRSILAATLLTTALAFIALLATGQRASASMPVSSCTGERYSDVCPGDWFYPYVMDLSDIGAVSGYGDGSFRPGSPVSRGQAMKILALAGELSAPTPLQPTFADVPPTHTFFTWIEIGAANGLASGYPCGAPDEPCDTQNRPYFRSGGPVSRGQLAKMIVNARRWSALQPEVPTFNDVPPGSPFFGYVERVAIEGVIGGYQCGGAPDGAEPCPGLYFRPAGGATRAQTCKMVSIARRRTPTPTITGTPPTATPTNAVRTPTPTATGTAGGPCPIFPANNIWNKNIAALPTHALSANYIASIGLTSHVHADFGSGLWQGEPIGIPFVVVPAGQPLVPIRFTAYGYESDPGPYPVPTNAPIEGGPNSTGDRHVLVVDSGTCMLYEMFSAYPNADGSWDCASGAAWSLTSNALRPAGWTSADAAGLPIYPGLVRYDEVASGVVRHAIRFTAPRTQTAYLWPARHQSGSSADPNLPPMGLRVRLKAGVDLSGYPQPVRVILQALKDYGMILADNGSPWYISGAPDPRWDNDLLHAMDDLQGSDFEAVDESGLMISPNSGESR